MARRPASVAVLFLVAILSVTGCAASLHGGQPVGGGSYRIVPLEGSEFILDGLAIFTIESRTGQPFTDYVLRQGHSVP